MIFEIYQFVQSDVIYLIVTDYQMKDDPKVPEKVQTKESNDKMGDTWIFSTLKSFMI